MQGRSTGFVVRYIPENLAVDPRPGVLQHQPLFSVARLITINALLVNLLLENIFHLVRLGDVDGKFAIVVDSRHISTVIKQVPKRV